MESSKETKKYVQDIFCIILEKINMQMNETLKTGQGD